MNILNSFTNHRQYLIFLIIINSFFQIFALKFKIPPDPTNTFFAGSRKYEELGTLNKLTSIYFAVNILGSVSHALILHQIISRINLIILMFYVFNFLLNLYVMIIKILYSYCTINNN